MDTLSIRKQCTAIVCCMVYLNKGVCGPSFPSIREVLDLEIPNMWSLPNLISWKPYRDSLETRVQREIVCDPWNRTMDLRDLITTILDSLVKAGIEDETITRIRDTIFRSDPVIYSTVRRGLSPMEISVQDDIVQGTCEAFGVDPDTVIGDIEDMYKGIFTQIN